MMESKTKKPLFNNTVYSTIGLNIDICNYMSKQSSREHDMLQKQKIEHINNWSQTIIGAVEKVFFGKFDHHHINKEHGRNNEYGQLCQDACSYTVERKSQESVSLPVQAHIPPCQFRTEKEIEDSQNTQGGQN